MATFLSYHDLQQQGILYSEAHALQYLINVGILRPHQYCEECQTYMELKSCPTARYSDGYNWACPDDIHLLSVRADSVLHRRKISFTSFLHLLWLFCNRISVSDAARLVSSNIKTVRTLFTSLRQCMAEDLLDNGVRRKIGGPGHIIEIDESKFGRRKYNRGRRVVGKWILGGYCRTTGECFLTECTNNKRDHHTLLRLIKQNVLPGTIILTDKWKGYNSLSHHGFIHLVVNHRQGFVDPLTGVHTNTCEGMWFHAKKHMRQGHGRTRVDSTAVSIALCEFVWLKKFEPRVRVPGEITPISAEQSGNHKNNESKFGAQLAIDLKFFTVARTDTIQSWLKISLGRVHCVKQAIRYGSSGPIIKTYFCTASRCGSCGGENDTHCMTVSTEGAPTEIFAVSDCKYGNTVKFEKRCCNRQYFNAEVAIIGKIEADCTALAPSRLGMFVSVPELPVPHGTTLTVSVYCPRLGSIREKEAVCLFGEIFFPNGTVNCGGKFNCK
ncbi:hypothetical protein ACHWQZ_G000842 [Mnemiopsis leidyi]